MLISLNASLGYIWESMLTGCRYDKSGSLKGSYVHLEILSELGRDLR